MRLRRILSKKVIAIVAIVLLVLGVYIVTAEPSYWETEASFGTWREEILVGLKDGSEIPIKGFASWNPFTVKYDGEEIVYIKYRITAVVDAEGFDYCELDCNEYDITGTIQETGSSEFYDGEEIGVLYKPVGTFLIREHIFEVAERMKDYDAGFYNLDFTYSGYARYRGVDTVHGYTQEDWIIALLPEEKDITLEVTQEYNINLVISDDVQGGYAVDNVVLKYSKQYLDTIRPFDPPIAADTDNDGKLDALYIAGRDLEYGGGIGGGKCICFDGETGDIIWERTYIDADASNELNPIELWDITGDGCPEVFCHWGVPSGGYQIGLICMNGKTGETIWHRTDSSYYRPAWHHFVILADEHTGVPYIFYNSHSFSGSQFYMVKVDARNGDIIRYVPSGASCNGGVSAADLEGDGDVELVLGAHSGFEVYDTDLNPLWGSGSTQSSTQCVKLIDINKDGVLDLVSAKQLGNSDSGLNVADGATHTWMPGYHVSRYSSYGWSTSVHEDTTIYDYDNDGYYEIAIGDYDTYVHVIQISNPPILEKILTDLGKNKGSGIFMDLVGDERVEWVSTSTWTIHDTVTWERVEGTPKINGWSEQLVDIDGDGYFEMVCSNNGGYSVYDTGKRVVENINGETSHWGYRRLKAEIPYEECEGSWFKK